MQKEMQKKIICQLKKAGKKEIKIPGDKSISHRSIIFGSIAHGLTEVSHFLTGEDCICTMNAFKALGVEIEFNEAERKVKIHGRGFANLKEPSKAIDLGNSGTGMRLLTGLFAGLPFTTTLIGDESLSGRPMGRVIDPLAEMGAVIKSHANKAPLIINPDATAKKLKAIDYVSKIASAQVKSCILLAGLNADGITSVSEPEKSRDHTELMMRSFGADLKIDGLKTSINGSESINKLKGQKIEVPGDISSSAFFLVAGAILPGAELHLINVGINPTRTGILDVLKTMQVKFKLVNKREVNHEAIADIVVYHSEAQATTIEGDLIPRLIDEIPVISILAAQAKGTTVIKDAAELKVKESNRITTTINMLKHLGVTVEETEDGMIIEGRSGKPFEPPETKTIIDSHGDHRLAMSSAIAALHSTKPIEILQTEFVNTSFPEFFEIIEAL